MQQMQIGIIKVAQQHPDVDVPIYGIPVNTREALGVLHLKGFIF